MYPWAVPAVVVMGVLSALLEGIGIGLFIPLVSALGENGAQGMDEEFLGGLFQRLLGWLPAEQWLVVLPLLILGAILLKNALFYTLEALFAWVNSRISYRLRSGIFDQLLSISYPYLEKREAGALLNTLATESWRTSRALADMVTLLVSCCTIVVFVTLLLLISWQLTLVVGACMVLISGGIHLVTRRSREIGEHALQANRKLADRMLDALGGMRVIRAFGNEPFEQRRFDQSSERVRSSFLKLDLISAGVAPLSEVLYAALLMGILLVGLAQQQVLPELVVFLLLLFRLQPQVRNLDAARVALLGFTSSVLDVTDFVDRSDKPYPVSGQASFETLSDELSFHEVTFRYGGSRDAALERISFSIPSGGMTAIVGPSGAGKSTIINLLLRLYDPTEGEIRVDDVPLHEIDLKGWRAGIALVGQETYLFKDTIQANITYGKQDATDDEVIAAAKRADAHDFVRELPDGYDTMLGDRGGSLSGGQRQRVALARAVLRDPKVLILDEAVNAVDNQSEMKIRESISRLGTDTTVIVVAHRLSTVVNADRILVVDRGRLVDRGTFEELQSRKGVFMDLYRVEHASRFVTTAD